MAFLRIVQIIFFVLASTIEIHVKADEVINIPEIKAPIEVPENCLVENSLCTIKTSTHQKYNVRMDQSTVTLSPKTVYARLSAQSGSVLEGFVFVNAKEKFRMEKLIWPEKYLSPPA